MFRSHTHEHKLADLANEHPLSQVRPGNQALIRGFDASLPAAQRQHLQAYGLQPGRAITVIAQFPVTIIQIEHTELAFEARIARGVMVSREQP